MRKILAATVMFLVTVCSAWAAEGVDTKLHGISQYAQEKNRVIVCFRSEKAMDRLEKTFSGSIRHRYHRFPMVIAELSGREAAALVKDRDVLSIEVDSTYYLHYIGGVIPTNEYEPYGLARMGITQAFHEKGYLGQGVKVGIIDSGVASGHPDLHVAGGSDFTYSETGLLYYEDVLGHGTHVAGIIAAKRNGIGVAGVAPEAELYSLQCFNIFGQAALSSIINCIQWAMDHELDVLNMSFGGVQNSPALKEACQRAYDSGILLVAAAGNSGRGEDTVSYPAKYNTVVAVSATDENDEIADFSSRGPAVEVAAPGVNILSTITYPPYYELSYDYLSGTSMACPHVVGMAALIKSTNPGISNEEVRRHLQRFAKDLGAAGRDNEYGYGIPRPERDPALMADQFNPVVNAGGPYRSVVGEPVVLSASGTLDLDDNLLRYVWGFGDGVSGEGRFPVHTYARPGVYGATLTVTDQDGRTGSATAEVTVDAGINRSGNLEESDAGFVREPNIVYHDSIIQAGVNSGNTYYGLVKFDTPVGSDVRVLSAELVLTVTTKSPKDEGIITAGLLPSEVVEHWSAITYAEIEEAEVIVLNSPIVMSSLHTDVAQGLENRFSVPGAELASFEDQFRRGSVAFRMTLDTTLSSNRVEWTSPKLIVRYLEGISTGNMAPVADAGYDRRALAGSRITLDGSMSRDFEGTALTYRWVQRSGTPVTLSSQDSAVAEFTAPGGNEVLVFQLAVSDGVFESADEVKIFLNSAPAEIHQMVLIPGFGNAGYVEEDHPTVNFFDKREILVGSLLREYQGTVGMPDGQATAVGAMRFDLSEIPVGSQVVSAKLEITGKSRWTDKRSKFVIKVLTPETDERWETLNYLTLTNAEVVSNLSPTLDALMVKRDVVNQLEVSPETLEARRDSSNKITFRIDGPDKRVWADNTFFSWWSGNEEQTAAWGPRLIVEYGAIEAEEPPVPPPPEENLPPVPQISTEATTAKPGEPANFTLSATDPEGKRVMFTVDWGDVSTESTALCGSGEAIVLSHTWTEQGSYVITVVATDEQGAASQPITLGVEISETTEEVLVISDTWTGTWYLGSSYSRRRQAQTFQSIGSTIREVSLALTRIGNPSKPIRVSIRYSLTGMVLGSGEVNPSQVTSTDANNPGWVSVALGAAVREGTSYYLVLEVDGNDSSNYYRVGYNGNNPYPYGIYYPDSGTSGRREIDMVCKIVFEE